MSELKLLVFDAFTDRAYKGNPCAVVLDADALSVEQMQVIAQETNLSETAFVLSSDKALCRVRYFTPRTEIPFAGHPTIATTFALAELGRIPLSGASTTVAIEFSIGVLPVTVETREGMAEHVVMTQPAPTYGEFLDFETAALGLGLQAANLHPVSQPQVAGVGVPFLMIAVRDRQTLLELSPKWSELCRTSGAMGLSGVYVFAPGGCDSKTSLCARFFDPFAQYEDPFTGSACGAMAALALRNGLIQEMHPIVEQGESVGQIGRATVHLHDADKKILVGGSATRVVTGTICSPLASTSGES